MSQSTETAGKAVQEFEAAAVECKMIEATAPVENADGSVIEVVACLYPDTSYRKYFVRSGGSIIERFHSLSLAEVMVAAGQKFGKGKLDIPGISISANKHPSLTRAQITKLARAAWCEVFGVNVPSEVQLKALSQSAKADTIKGRAEIIEHLGNGALGVEKWNHLTPEERTEFGALKKLDLSDKDLACAHLSGGHSSALDMQGCNFDNSMMAGAKGTHLDARKSTFRNANLDKSAFQAKLHECDFSGASIKNAYLTSSILSKSSFEGADLTDISFYGSDLRDCKFVKANLTNAKMTNTDLRGADLSSANLTGAYLEGAKYDEKTRFPGEISFSGKLKWVGDGADPLKVARAKTATAVVAGDFDSFMTQLKAEFDKARVDKCIKMLKAERFSLFADVSEEALTGVVKSQTDPDLVYSCRLTNEGAFACCTQNLNPCGGLRGALCKHLLVLMIGLTKAGELDPTRAYELTMASKAREPKLDKDVMSETFLRYKGAQTGEIDWRPTETMPEDYYAF